MWAASSTRMAAGLPRNKAAIHYRRREAQQAFRKRIGERNRAEIDAQEGTVKKSNIEINTILFN